MAQPQHCWGALALSVLRLETTALRDDEPIDETDRTYFLGLRIAEERGGRDDPSTDGWSGTVYDQMVPEINMRFRGIRTIPECVLAVVGRLRRGERRRFPRPGLPHGSEAPGSTDDSPEGDDA
jgi:hypothetical protein